MRRRGAASDAGAPRTRAARRSRGAAQHHLCRFPVQKSAPNRSSSTASMPAAWAPSTRTAVPRSLSAGSRDTSGIRRAVADATWSTTVSRVRSVTAPRTAAVTSSSGARSGTWTTTTRAPASPAHRSAAMRTAPYVWSVTRISSSCDSSMHDSTVLTPAVALRTKASESGSAPRKWLISARACPRAAGCSRTKKRTGLASMRSRQDCCSSSTAVGTAPNDPWLRCETVPSSGQRALTAGQSSPQNSLVCSVAGDCLDTLGSLGVAFVQGWHFAPGTDGAMMGPGAEREHPCLVVRSRW